LIPNEYSRRLHQRLWNTEPATRVGRMALHAARYAMALARDMAEGEITLRAMSLVYTTLLSLVPLLALAFSMLKGLGMHESLEPALEHLLSPLGDQSALVAQSLVGFIDNMRVGVLGFLGVIMLIYTALSMIAKVESSFNFIWRIDNHGGVVRRFGEYLVVLLVGPALVLAALGLTASLRSSQLVQDVLSIEPFGSLILFLSKALPYLLIIGALAFCYAYLPNTRVRLGAAMVGGVFGGITWQTASVAFATFVVSTSYKAVYSGFAVVILLLLWIYVGWVIILLGCRLAFYVQNPRFLEGTVAPPPSSRAAESLALRLMALVAQRFLAGEPPLGFEALCGRLAAPAEHLERAIAVLSLRGLLAEVQPGRLLLPARDPDSYSVAQLWLWTRGEAPEPGGQPAPERQALLLLDELERRVAAAPSPSLRQWLQSGAAGTTPSP
jgi:membrane protein